MKVVCISDTHGYHDDISMPEGDMLIHAGDFTNIGSPKEILNFNNWLGKLNYKHKIVIPGNHDRGIENIPNAASLISNATILIHNQSPSIDRSHHILEIEDKYIYIVGAQYSPRFSRGWAFNYDRKNGEDLWKEVLLEARPDILITHTPPFGVLDKVKNIYHDVVGGDYAADNDGSVGCKDLLASVLKKKPKLHVFGHIHEGYGIFKNNDTTFVNASIWDHYNACINKPIVVEI